MAKRKVLGVSAINYKDIVNFKIKLDVEYTKTSGERIKREVEYDIQTTDKETAIDLAIKKAKSELAEFPYIKKIM